MVAMTEFPTILSGLSEIAGDYDALICDVWGVVHDGVKPHWPAVEALKKFRATRGRVVLLSNAPRPALDIAKQFVKIGVPTDCYDAIVTSGGAAREDLAGRSKHRPLPMMHLGPPRDRNLYEGLNLELCGPQKAAVVLVTGPYDDENETPDDYAELLSELRSHGLPMICANPDIVVPRGERIVYCAGALARAYEAIGGEALYYGKPHLPIYKAALEAAGGAKRPLVIGDGLDTDIRGANGAGIDALFVAHGLHRKDIGDLTPTTLAALFAAKKVSARAAMSALAW